MTESAVKAAVREYVREQFGQCRSASVVIDLGNGIAPEVLLVVTPPSSAKARPESLPSPACILPLETA